MLIHPVLLFFDVSGGELLVIILVVFLVFGPQKMPEIARKIGRAVNEMKKATNDLTKEFRQETTGIRSEILAAQDKVKDEISNVNQEVEKTRARVFNDLSIPEDPPSKDVSHQDAHPASEPLPDMPGPSEKAG